MDQDQIREIIQLILAAKNFFNISKRRFSKLKPESKQKTMQDLKKKVETPGWSKEDKDLLILTSYLSSCGIRISTIYEVMKIKPDNNALYVSRLDRSNTCHFVRDNVCHKEPKEEDKKKLPKKAKFS